jgi:hypothetical protein
MTGARVVGRQAVHEGGGELDQTRKERRPRCHAVRPDPDEAVLRRATVRLGWVGRTPKLASVLKARHRAASSMLVIAVLS